MIAAAFTHSAPAAEPADPICDAASRIAASGADDAVTIAVELLTRADRDPAQIVACLGPAPAPTPAPTIVDLGTFWEAFTKDVGALVPIATFVGVSALVLLAIARLLALVPGLRDVRSQRWARRFAWITGLILAVVTPALIALRGMWISARKGPTGVEVAGLGFEAFIAAVFFRSGGWWMLLLLALLTVATLTFAFSTRQGVTVKLQGTTDGKGLDTAHVMAAMDGMAGRTNRGMEFPVGTDLTDAAGVVTELSKNTVVATLQVAVSAILGSTPWRLTIENADEKSASVTISRNGALVKAKRVKIGDELATVTERTSAELLAAQICGELIAALRSRYSAEFDAHLSGATDGESIALHYVASSALTTTREARARGIPILARSVELDPQNRAAWTTLANFAYRDPKVHDPQSWRPHVQYREFLDRAIIDELTRARGFWDDEYALTRPRAHSTEASGATATATTPTAAGRTLAELNHAVGRVRPARMQRNALLVRLLQTRVVAAVNAEAAGEVAVDPDAQMELDAAYRMLRRRTFGGPPSKGEPPKLAVRRRQLLLIDEFRVDHDAASFAMPTVLADDAFGRERDAWRAAAAAPFPLDPVAKRVACEDAALAVSGDFAHDPFVAYSVACHRAQLWKITSTGGSP
ncbi:hypothetical protein [Microbacterium atlanticum]|uniref:hypothetical protein n=1 Tax=Microbacterium atlanticum TaxID=2782168 RepID=UPI001888BB76|nr:hypothetical protein [Microbacterium atlanticum]